MLKQAFLCLLSLPILSACNQQAEPQSAAQASQRLTPEQQTLIRIGEKCIDFGDRDVANITPVIEFQQLEKISRRANVIERCMTDNGYIQNPAWLRYAEPVAQAEAKQQNISVDEAMVNLSRRHQEILLPDKTPPYWVKGQSPQ